MEQTNIYCDVTECLLNSYGICKCESRNNGKCDCMVKAAGLEVEDGK